jgi:carboxysome shell carbonic anhydrase
MARTSVAVPGTPRGSGDGIERHCDVAAHGCAHPLAEPAWSAALQERATTIKASLDRIAPMLQSLARRQFDEGFADAARRELSDAFGLDLAPSDLQSHWAQPLALGQLHARCVLAVFAQLIERDFDRNLARLAQAAESEDAATLIGRFGFHAIDITPCADGRLAGVVDYILRVPPQVVTHIKSHAGAMFDVEETLRHWETMELRRWRDGRPNRADAPTRYLKIGVYHYSSLDPERDGCAAHGSDGARAAGQLLLRLQQFERAVHGAHGDGAGVAILLVGVDTDTDAIRVHVPDAAGACGLDRHVDSAVLYRSTQPLDRESAKSAIRAAVAACAGVAADDAATEGMRWLCGYLLKNNLAQVDAVRREHGSAYADRGHTEHLIVVGDGIDEVQLRNLAFQAQMDTVEEGAVDLDVGIRILGHLHAPRGLAVPVLAHSAYDDTIPGARERAEQRARRLAAAVSARHAQACRDGDLVVRAAVHALGQARLDDVSGDATAGASA